MHLRRLHLQLLGILLSDLLLYNSAQDLDFFIQINQLLTEKCTVIVQKSIGNPILQRAHETICMVFGLGSQKRLRVHTIIIGSTTRIELFLHDWLLVDFHRTVYFF